MDRRRKGIVGTLCMIDMVIGVYRVLAAQRIPEHLIGSIGDHLVAVHVGLGTGSGLVDHQRKLIVQVAGNHLFCGRIDGAGDLGGDTAQFCIDCSCSLLDQAHRSDQRTAHPLLSDAEVLEGSLRLCTPQSIRLDLHLTHRVLLDAVFHRQSPRRVIARLCSTCRQGTPRAIPRASDAGNSSSSTWSFMVGFPGECG